MGWNSVCPCCDKCSLWGLLVEEVDDPYSSMAALSHHAEFLCCTCHGPWLQRPCEWVVVPMSRVLLPRHCDMTSELISQLVVAKSCSSFLYCCTMQVCVRCSSVSHTYGCLCITYPHFILACKVSDAAEEVRLQALPQCWVLTKCSLCISLIQIC